MQATVTLVEDRLPFVVLVEVGWVHAFHLLNAMNVRGISRNGVSCCAGPTVFGRDYGDAARQHMPTGLIVHAGNIEGTRQAVQQRGDQPQSLRQASMR